MYIFLLKAQYEFVYKAVLDATSCGNTATLCEDVDLKGIGDDVIEQLKGQFEVSNIMVIRFDRLKTILKLRYVMFIAPLQKLKYLHGEDVTMSDDHQSVSVLTHPLFVDVSNYYIIILIKRLYLYLVKSHTQVVIHSYYLKDFMKF